MKLTLLPDCLKWARERAGFSVPGLAKKLGIQEEKIAAWEQSGELTWSLAERLAHVTHTPFGYLFLPSPPIEQLPISDFRTVQTQAILRPSLDLLDTVNDALRRQDWYRDYILSNSGEPLAFAGSLTISSNILEAARRIRDVVRWNAALWKEQSSADSPLSRHVETVEEAGILVMRSSIVGNDTHRHLQVSEFRGFALADKYAPLIFINSADAKAAQLFTLAHELVHIWLGISGITNLNQTRPPDISVERFCNSVAVELLVPMQELRPAWAKNAGTIDPIYQTARQFGVSSLVILRRLFDAGFLTEEEFQRRYTDELSQIRQRTAEKEGGGDFYRTLNTRLGKRFVSALVESTLEGRTSYRDAYQLLGVKNAETVRKLASTLEAVA